MRRLNESEDENSDDDAQDDAGMTNDKAGDENMINKDLEPDGKRTKLEDNVSEEPSTMSMCRTKFPARPQLQCLRSKWLWRQGCAPAAHCVSELWVR